jgi:hypothetical protein
LASYLIGYPGSGAGATRRRPGGMHVAARDLKSVIYTDDYGRTYATKMDASVFAQVGASTNRKVGGADYAATPKIPAMPAQMRPRHVVVSAAGRPKRRVVCLTPDAELFDGTETTIDLPDLGGAAVTFTVYASNGEEWPARHDPAQ